MKLVSTVFKHFSKYMKMSEINQKFVLPQRYTGSEPSVWTEYIQLALDYKPLNLGQGFPDEFPPKYVTDTLVEVAKDRSDYTIHQYARGFGHPRLIKALAKLYSKLIGRQINERTEILVCIGGYEALFSAISGHTDVGDEVIVIEPYFDCYEPMIKYAGGIPRFIPLRPKEVSGRLLSSADWVLNKEELESLFNEKTKMIIVNSPNNPLGKVFSMEELTFIADLCKKWNVLCLSDEVYEWMVFKPHKHIRIATLPGMWERTITIGSGGKTFSVTGWKVGWVYCPENLMKNLHIVHQNSVYTGVTPVQVATAIAFEIEMERMESDDCYFVSLARELEAKRDYMVNFLVDIGMKPTIPDAGYFMLADWSALESKVDMNSENDKYNDFRFTKWMTKNVSLQGIPPSAFFSSPNKYLAEHCVRYCYMKINNELIIVGKVLFTDEAGVTRNGFINLHNLHLWGDKKPHGKIQIKNQNRHRVYVCTEIKTETLKQAEDILKQWKATAK